MMIRAERITKRFGRFTAVDDLSFVVHPGEALALWGSNGAGKTTVIRCVLGLLRYQGRICIDGVDVHRCGRHARRLMGYVPQELALHDDLAAIEALHFYAQLKQAGSDRPAQVLAQVGLADHGKKKVRELSGGMKQRLSLAAAMLADPPVLVLDELTSNLDASAQSGFMELLEELKQAGKTILFTSHRLEEVEVLADRVIVLEKGRLKHECQPDELAETLGLRSTLKLFVADGLIPEAVRQLRLRGFMASANGTGLHVEVGARSKGLPIRALHDAAIFVRDFEFSNGECDRHGGGNGSLHDQ